MSKLWLEMASTSTNAYEQSIRTRAQSLLTETGDLGPLLPYEQARDVVAELIEALTTTSGNLHSLRAASPGVWIYDSWIEVVDAALARCKGEGA